jgi:hypothetical protein
LTVFIIIIHDDVDWLGYNTYINVKKWKFDRIEKLNTPKKVEEESQAIIQVIRLKINFRTRTLIKLKKTHTKTAIINSLTAFHHTHMHILLHKLQIYFHM